MTGFSLDSLDRACVTTTLARVVLIGALMLAALSPTCADAAFTATEAPPVVSNAGVKAGGERERHESFEVETLFTLTCPGERTPTPVAVSFTDANGETTEHLTRPCNGEWAPNNTEQPNPLTEWSVMAFPGFAPILTGEAGSPPYVLFTPPPEASGPHPFLYQVTGPTGVIAQAPITATTTPEQRVNESSAAFQGDCAAHGNVKREASGAGYCVVPAATTYTTGWPAAPPRAPRVVLLCPSAGSGTLPRVKPTRCNTLRPGQALANGSNLANLRWHSWGGSEATASGVELGNHRPLAHVPASVRAYRLTRCNEKEARYTRLRVHDRYATRTYDLPECGRS